MAEKIKLIIDSTLSKNKNFSSWEDIEVEKQDIFNFGIFKYEVPPEKIGENDFEYLQSKIPAYTELYEDYIEMPNGKNSIICKVEGEAASDVSEIVGIAIGLKTTMDIFGIEKRKIRKIGQSGKREKRLDYKATNKDSQFEIETKGTTNKYRINSMINDIHAKKEGKDGGICRYGFITLLRKTNDNDESYIYATDPIGEI